MILAKAEIADAYCCTVRSVRQNAPAAQSCCAALGRGNLKINCQWNLSGAGRRDKYGIAGCRQISCQPKLVGFAGGIRDGWGKCLAVADLNHTSRAEVDQAAQRRLQVGSWSKEAERGVHGRGRRRSGKGRREAMGGRSSGETNALRICTRRCTGASRRSRIAGGGNQCAHC